PVVDVTMMDYAFQAPDSIPSGWVTFQAENVGEETHEFMLARLPEGRTFEEFRTFIEPLDSLKQLLVEGAIDSTEYEEASEQIVPDWANEEVEFVGGGGPLGPGQTGRSTLRPEPGRYMVVCWISSPNGRRHDYQGMYRGITVTEDSSGAGPPEADVTLRSAGREISVEGQPRSGEQTVAFHVEEPPEDLESPYNWAFVAPLGPEISAEQLRELEWTNEDLHATESRGGVGRVPVGQTRYFTVDLEPGRYAWRLSVATEDMVKEFTIE
ncbi:MAG: hypothetical protein V5A58_13760, partial [Salinibacter sp.]|uniref:hypothetical protein n=1 Tax=Salinibacter sp. TaxID=2065818 RepID=UPI002FC2D870